MENERDQIPPCPGGPPSHVRRWEQKYGEGARAADAASSGEVELEVVPDEESAPPKPVAKKKAKKKASRKSGS